MGLMIHWGGISITIIMVVVTNAMVVIEVMLVEGGSVIIVELRIKYA
jgi:hypothetical protein